MECDQISQLLTAELHECEISVEGGGGKYLVVAIGQIFDGLNAVKRQQIIYKILNEHIASGAIHAVTMRLMTDAERKNS